MPVAHSDERIRECPLVQWQGDPKRCRFCDAELTGRQQRWCATCGLVGHGWFAHHDWAAVRLAALRRDGYRCTQCNVEPDDAYRLLLAACYVEGLRPQHAGPGTLWLPGPSPTFRTNRQDRMWAWAQRRYMDTRLEVNHIVPILGKHAQPGCHHHLDGVETLCHGCHVRTTAQQFGHHAPKADPCGTPSMF